jgi:energy-coupling factor transport system ATP-binding protein
MDEAILADRIVVLDRGRIVLDGVPAEVYEEVELLKSVGTGRGLCLQTTDLMQKLRCAG